MTRMIGLFAVLLTSCATTGSTGKGVDWPSVASCGEPVASDALGSVTSVLLGDGPADQTSISERAVAQLEELAAKHTPNVIACLVDAFVRGSVSAHPTGATAMPSRNRVAAAKRGQDFLRRVAGTSVIRREVEP